jgi:hypothetical protein
MAETAPVGAEEEEEQPGVVVTMHVNDIKNFTNLVSLLRWSNKQVHPPLPLAPSPPLSREQDTCAHAARVRGRWRWRGWTAPG